MSATTLEHIFVDIPASLTKSPTCNNCLSVAIVGARMFYEGIARLCLAREAFECLLEYSFDNLMEPLAICHRNIPTWLSFSSDTY